MVVVDFGGGLAGAGTQEASARVLRCAVHWVMLPGVGDRHHTPGAAVAVRRGLRAAAAPLVTRNCARRGETPADTPADQRITA